MSVIGDAEPALFDTAGETIRTNHYDSTVTVQPIHALVFLDERHAGIIGAGEFYDDQFDMAVESPQEAFLTDFATEFK